MDQEGGKQLIYPFCTNVLGVTFSVAFVAVLFVHTNKLAGRANVLHAGLNIFPKLAKLPSFFPTYHFAVIVDV